MKKNLILALLSMFAILSCSKDEPAPKPTVSFTGKSQGEGMFSFFSSSANADKFTWDFGDGGTSSDKNPFHVYASNGKYNVTLSASGKGGSAVEVGSVTVNDITGSVLFWMSSMRDKNIEVTLSGKTGTISGYYSSGEPSCGAAKSATFSNLKEGIYKYEAREVGAFFPSVWNGDIKVIGRKCSSVKLSY